MQSKYTDINDNNYQSFMVVEYVLRFLTPGSDFTAQDLLNFVPFKDKRSDKGYRAAVKGINIAIKKMLEPRDGRQNIVAISSPTEQTVYRFVDPTVRIEIEKNKLSGYISVDGKYFETQNSGSNSYSLSKEVVEKISTLGVRYTPINRHAISNVEVKTDFDQDFSKQVEQMTQAQKLSAMMILYKSTSEQLTDALSVIEITSEQ